MTLNPRRGIADLADMYYLSDGGEHIVDSFGLPWENMESAAI